MKIYRLFFLIALVALALCAAPAQAAPNGSTLVVTSTLDNTTGSDGKCTLREAITNANANSDTTSGDCAAGSGTDTITFNIPSGISGGVCSIFLGTCFLQVQSPLPDLGDPVVIDGYTQPGASPNTLAVGEEAQIRIILSGKSESGNGLHLTGGSSTIKGLNIQNFYVAVLIESDNNGIEGNFIGTDSSGVTAVPNYTGIDVEKGNNNHIGGATTEARNIISGSDYIGVLLENGSNNLIQGNYIGTDAQGHTAIPNNTYGIDIFHESQTTVGGKGTLARNVISGNNGNGIDVSGNSPDAEIRGNYVGLGADGSTSLGNLQNGISLIAGSQFSANLVITKNRIANNGYGANNGYAGIVIGYDSNDQIYNVSVSHNKIFSNNGLGIDLARDGVTPNDSGDGDTGPNGLQNFPVLKSATSGGGSTTVKGSLKSHKNTSYRIEFFKSPNCDSSGNGEGSKYLGYVTVTTNDKGNVGFTFVKSKNYPVGNVITATATELVNGELGSTSEFSQCVTVTN